MNSSSTSGQSSSSFLERFRGKSSTISKEGVMKSLDMPPVAGSYVVKESNTSAMSSFSNSTRTAASTTSISGVTTTTATAAATTPGNGIGSASSLQNPNEFYRTSNSSSRCGGITSKQFPSTSNATGNTQTTMTTVVSCSGSSSSSAIPKAVSTIATPACKGDIQQIDISRTFSGYNMDSHSLRPLQLSHQPQLQQQQQRSLLQSRSTDHQSQMKTVVSLEKAQNRYSNVLNSTTSKHRSSIGLEPYLSSTPFQQGEKNLNRYLLSSLSTQQSQSLPLATQPHMQQSAKGGGGFQEARNMTQISFKHDSECANGFEQKFEVMPPAAMQALSVFPQVGGYILVPVENVKLAQQQQDVLMAAAVAAAANLATNNENENPQLSQQPKVFRQTQAMSARKNHSTSKNGAVAATAAALKLGKNINANKIMLGSSFDLSNSNSHQYSLEHQHQFQQQKSDQITQQQNYNQQQQQHQNQFHPYLSNYNRYPNDFNYERGIRLNSRRNSAAHNVSKLREFDVDAAEIKANSFGRLQYIPSIGMTDIQPNLASIKDLSLDRVSMLKPRSSMLNVVASAAAVAGGASASATVTNMNAPTTPIGLSFDYNNRESNMSNRKSYSIGSSKGETRFQSTPSYVKQSNKLTGILQTHSAQQAPQQLTQPHPPPPPSTSQNVRRSKNGLKLKTRIDEPINSSCSNVSNNGQDKKRSLGPSRYQSRRTSKQGSKPFELPEISPTLQIPLQDLLNRINLPMSTSNCNYA